MADAKKCDRCGKLFEPYNNDAGCKVPTRYMNILLRNTLINQASYKEPRDYDLCKECNDSFLKWLSKPSVVNGNPSCFGEYDDKEYGCISCPVEQECKAVSKKKVPKCFGKFNENDHDCVDCELANDCKEKTTKQENEYKYKGCNVFGAFDGSIDCLMCPKCIECKEATKAIKEANAGE